MLIHVSTGHLNIGSTNAQSSSLTSRGKSGRRFVFDTWHAKNANIPSAAELLRFLKGLSWWTYQWRNQSNFLNTFGQNKCSFIYSSVFTSRKRVITIVGQRTTNNSSLLPERRHISGQKSNSCELLFMFSLCFFYLSSCLDRSLTHQMKISSKEICPRTYKYTRFSRSVNCRQEIFSRIKSSTCKKNASFFFRFPHKRLWEGTGNFQQMGMGKFIFQT